jgi:hypothetical protein
MMFGVTADEAARAIQAIMTGHDPYVEPGCPYCGTASSRDGHGFCVSCGAPPVLTKRASHSGDERIVADGLTYHVAYGAPDA